MQLRGVASAGDRLYPPSGSTVAIRIRPFVQPAAVEVSRTPRASAAKHLVSPLGASGGLTVIS